MSFLFRLPLLCDGIADCDCLVTADNEYQCSETVIIDHPDILTKAKFQAIANGADAVFSPTGGVTHDRLEEYGLDEEFSHYITFLTQVTKKTAGTDVLTGGVLMPTKLFKPPYTKNIFEDAYFAYLEKMTLLKSSDVDFVMLKNQNNLWDMRAGVLAAKSLNLPVFVTMNVDADGKNPNGTDCTAALITLQSIGADAFGIDCSDGITAEILLLQKIFPHAEIPLIAVMDTRTADKDRLLCLAQSGASVFIDKACQYDKEKAAIFKQTPSAFDPNTEKDSYAAAVECEAFFLPDNPELSEPMDCSYGMTDDIINMDDETIDAVYINLYSTDDAAMLSENASMSRLPFLIHTNNSVTLEAALRYYQGRLLVDSRCDINENELNALVKKYGAILY